MHTQKVYSFLRITTSFVQLKENHVGRSLSSEFFVFVDRFSFFFNLNFVFSVIF